MGSKFPTKQIFWFSIINYIGVFIGTFSTLFVYTKNKHLLGIFRYIDACAQMMYPIMLMGASAALLHFYPNLNTNFRRKLFSYALVSICLFSIIVGIGVLGVINFRENIPFWYTIFGFFIAIALAYIDLFKRQAMNLEKVAWPSFFEKIIPKLSLPLFFILIYYQLIDENKGYIGYILTYFLALLFISFYVFKYFQPIYSFSYKDLFLEIPIKEYYRYGVYAFTASIGSFFAFRVDSLMIPLMLNDFDSNGTYGIGVNVANMLMIPATGVFALYNPIISDYVKNGKIEALSEKYCEIAKQMLFVGIIFYGALILGIDNLFRMLPRYQELSESIPIIFILGASVLINMSMGFNSEIIAYSKYYRFHLIPIIVLAILTIGLNYIVLKFTTLGIVGVAFATLISMVVFNLIKLIFIYRKFNILPFDSVTFKIGFTGLLGMILFYILPDFKQYWLNVLIKSGGFVSFFILIVYSQNWLPMINKRIENYIKR